MSFIKQTSNKPKNIKYHNQKLILSMFQRAESLSIAEIAAQINLSKTTLTKVVNKFESKQIILATGKGNSTGEGGGRKPEIFTFNAAYSHFVVLAIQRKTIAGAVMDLKCNVLCQKTVDCDIHVNYREAIQILADMVYALIKESKLSFKDFCSIVVGCEGIIDAQNGIIRYTIHHVWDPNMTIQKDLSERLPFPIPIYVNNNDKLAGYSQISFNGHENDPLAVIINTPYSAGGSILENRQLISGTNGFIGELGHIIIEPHSDVKCSCGGYGCFGSLVSTATVLEKAYGSCAGYPKSVLFEKAKAKSLTINDIFTAANENDSFACSVLDEVIYYFSILIHNIVLLRDPEKIIIQGVYSEAGDFFLNKLREKVYSLPFYRMEYKIPLEYGQVSNISPYLRGAGDFAVKRFLDDNSLYD